MNLPITWEKKSGCEYATRNRIALARVWQTRAGNFQIAINLPLGTYKPTSHVFDTLDGAKTCVETAIQYWFNQIDA